MALALGLCLLLAACGPAQAQTASGTPGGVPQAGAASTAPGETPLLACQFYNHDAFLAGAASAQGYLQPSGRLLTGLVPHHLVAADMLSGFFTLAAAQENGYDRVILLSPSHYPQAAAGPVVTALAGWDTPFGTVEADEDAVRALLGDAGLSAREDPAALEQDHGVAGLVPYLAYYLPGTPLAACLLANGTGQPRLDALAETLKELCADGRTLLVASVDCSHYLQPAQAAERDAQTAAAIESFDYTAVRQFTDENVDSPECLSLFLRCTQSREAEPLQLDHAASVDKLPAGTPAPDGVTTYFVYAGFGPE